MIYLNLEKQDLESIKILYRGTTYKPYHELGGKLKLIKVKP